eukprot:Phypoly_transcript_20650.p1 GENE.Phypoly_transcript_20650~~Phypoly_transcript_20650.p1  ORF type:complete len:148 (+),score=28.37 Phypoly_transcript_20650:62-445(+)
MNGVYHSLVEKQKIIMRERPQSDEIHEEDKFNVPDQAIIAPVNQVAIDMGGDEMLNVPSASEMTKSANARRQAEKVDIKEKKKTVDRSYTLAVLQLMRKDWLLLFFGAIGGAIAGAVRFLFIFTIHF